MEGLILAASVAFSVGRSILSKKVSTLLCDRRHFFFTQMMLFLAACVVLTVMRPTALMTVSGETVGYALLYGLFLVLSQWMYTLALRTGNTAMCTIVYSFGFIIPTLTGVFFYGEPFGVWNILGLFLAMTVIVFSARPGGDAGKGWLFALPLIVAMLSSGGLGVMQKVQQNSAVADEKFAFLALAFLLAFAASLVGFLAAPRTGTPVRAGESLFPVLTGLCFGCANLFNTTLAGAMKGALFFPLQNMLTIMACAVCGVIFFGERITRRLIATVIMGFAAVCLLCA